MPNDQGVPAPNYTQIPNVILDRLMPIMSNSELRVVMAICRTTFGWHKECDCLSLTQLEKLTGMSRQGVINGVEALIARGVLTRYPKGRSFEYCLIVNDVDQEIVNEVDSKVKTIVNDVDIQNKDKQIKEKDKDIIAGAITKSQINKQLAKQYKDHPAIKIWQDRVNWDAPREKWSCLNGSNMALVATAIGEDERWLRAFAELLDLWRSSGWSLGNAAGFIGHMRRWAEYDFAPLKINLVQPVGQKPDTRSDDRNAELTKEQYDSAWARELRRKAGRE